MKNRKYIPNKNNGGIVPVAKDPRVLFVPVGCGKCMECKKQRSYNWKVRLSEEIRHRKDGYFVTLSFNDDSLYDIENGIGTDGVQYSQGIVGLDGYDLDNEIATKAVKFFRERWRRKYKKSIRHWLVTELGQTKTERIHLHGIIFCSKEQIKELRSIWQYGHVYVGEYVNERTIGYIVKYLSKTDEKHPEYNSKVLTSPGIGKDYLKRADSKRNVFKGEETNEKYKLRTGANLSLPIYYRNKLYSDEEREKLWLKKLDEQVRWVDGKKVDVSNGDDGYYRVLQEARKKNRRLKYGDDSINWEKRFYERSRRNMLKMERIRKNEKKR